MVSPRPRQPRNGFQVVREHIGIGGQHHVDVIGVAFEIAGQDFEGHVGACCLDASDGLGPMRRAKVSEVVAIDTGDDRVLEAEARQHLGDAARFVSVDRQRPTGGDVAEATRARADVAEDHDGQCFARPALTDVGAACALAHRVEAELLDHAAQFEERRLGRQGGANPFRMAAARLGCWR